MSGLDTTPTETGYINWIRTIMNITDQTILPDASPYINWSYEIAFEMVNNYLTCVSPISYTQAVYNLAGDLLVNMAQDQPGASAPTYWTDLRTSFGCNKFIAGLINAANDEDTSAASLVPLNLQNLTLADLQNLKTPWGRQYLAIAQSIGSMWGITY